MYKYIDRYLESVQEIEYEGSFYWLYTFINHSEKYKEWYIENKSYGIIMLIYGISTKGEEDMLLSIDSIIDAIEEYQDKYEDKD